MHLEKEEVWNDKTLNFSLIGIIHRWGNFDTFILPTNICCMCTSCQALYYSAITAVKRKVSCLLSFQACRLWRGDRNKIVKPVIVEDKVQGAVT